MFKPIWRDQVQSLMREYAETLILAFLFAFLLRYFVLGTYHIATDSMAPNLLSGDMVFGFKLPYGVEIPWSGGQKLGSISPERGDLVILRCPKPKEGYCLKRVVALAGDSFELVGKRLVINERLCEYRLLNRAADGVSWVNLEEHCAPNTRVIRINAERDAENFTRMTLPPGTVFVLSDFRDLNLDSRTWGPIPETSIVAKPFLIWLSLDWGAPESPRAWPSLRWDRVFSTLH